MRGWHALGLGLAMLLAALAVAIAMLPLAWMRAVAAAIGLGGLAGLAFAIAGARRLASSAGELVADKDRARAEAAQLARTKEQLQLDVQRVLDDLRRAHEELARTRVAAQGNEGQWRSLAAHAPGLILTVDREGSILYANRPLPGSDQPHSLGANLLQLVPPEERAAFRARLAAVFTRGEPMEHEVGVEGEQGRSWLLLRLGPVRRDGEVASAIVVGTDVTGLKHAAEAQREAAQHRRAVAQLEEQSSFKTQLLDTAAHELSNPLQSIQLQFAVLKMGGVDNLHDKQRQALDVMQRSFRRLRLLVADMRDLTRIQNGKLRIAPQPVDLAKLAGEAVDAFQEQARAADVGMELRAPRPVELVADGDRVAQVLYNLVSNAIKFTPAGGLVVVEAAQEGGQAVLRVHDTGRGLLPEQMAKLFKPFSQVHNPAEVKERGTGLGLYICRNLVEAHGGRIGVASEGPGQGTTFTVTLPLQVAAADGPSALPAQ